MWVVCFLLFGLVSSVDVSKLPHARQPEVSSCGICVDEAVLVINILLNAALNYEITGCGDLCSYLTNPYAIDACEVVCNGIGIYEFIQQLENSDIDPIYYCELIKLCTAQDCTGDCLDITSYQTIPAKAKVGATLDQYVQVDIKKPWSGTGMLRWILYVPGQEPLQDDQLLDGGIGPVGREVLKLELDTNDLQLYAGNYTTQILICNGECGSSHPHSRIFAQANSTFILS